MGTYPDILLRYTKELLPGVHRRRMGGGGNKWLTSIVPSLVKR